MAMALDAFRGYDIFSILLRFILAMAVGGLIGVQRGRRGRAAGMRTHILVCLGAALTTTLGGFCAEHLHHGGDPLRIGAQVVSGIGFLGVGTILVRGQSHITGLTTAAGLWTTAAVGLALGAGFYEGALLCGLLSYGAIALLGHMERRSLAKQQQPVYLELDDVRAVNAVLAALRDQRMMRTQAHVEVCAARSGLAGHVGLIVPMDPKKAQDPAVRTLLAHIPGIVFVIDN